MVVLRETFVKRNRYKTIRLKYLRGWAFNCFFNNTLFTLIKVWACFWLLFFFFLELHCILLFLSEGTEDNSSCWPAVTFLALTVSLNVSRALTQKNRSFVFPHSWQDVVQGPPEALRKTNGHSRLSVAVHFPKPGAGGRTRNTAMREKLRSYVTNKRWDTGAAHAAPQ